MTAGHWDITLEQGAAFGESYLIKGGDGAVLNLTGCRAALQVRAWPCNPTALLTLTTENDGLVIDGPNGTITPHFATSPLNPGAYVYDLKLYDSAGNPIRLIEGRFMVVPGITKV